MAFWRCPPNGGWSGDTVLRESENFDLLLFLLKILRTIEEAPRYRWGERMDPQGVLRTVMIEADVNY